MMGLKIWHWSLGKGLLLFAFCMVIVFGSSFLSAHPNEEEETMVYFLSKKMGDAYITVNDRELGYVNVATKIEYKMSASGQLRISAKMFACTPSEVELNVKEGEKHYVLVSCSEIIEISYSAAQRILKRTKTFVRIDETLYTNSEASGDSTLHEPSDSIPDEVPERPVDHSVLHYISRDMGTAKIYLNERFITALGYNEMLDYKIYSEGRMAITVYTSKRSLLGHLDVEHGEHYYLSHEALLEYSLQYSARKYVNRVVNTLTLEEDQRYPLIREVDNKGTSYGTCFMINNEGYLLTNHHVIEDAEKIQVKGLNGDFNKWYGVHVVARDADLDLALLKFKNDSLQFEGVPYAFHLGTVAQGTESFVLGYPLTRAMGEEIKVTKGIIGAASGFKGSLSQYQFSAAIQPGNSGSPLFSSEGEVIGIINSKLVGAENTGYAIKVAYISTFLTLAGNISLSSGAAAMPATLADQAAAYKPFIFIVKAE